MTRPAARSFAARAMTGWCLAMGSFAANADAAILAYLSAKGMGEGAAPIAPQETIALAAGSGVFHVWVQTDELLAGVSLDLTITGDAISFSGATTHNPASGAGLRWLPGLMRHGDVSDAAIRRVEGGALVGLSGSGQGVGPTTAAGDALHDHAGGFLFATISYTVENATGSAIVDLSIGHNRVADDEGLATDPIFLGPGDGPVANVTTASGSVADLAFALATLADADFDSDGAVAGRDFALWQRGVGLLSGAARLDGDATGDGRVDDADLAKWEMQFGTVAARPHARPAPEPPALTMLLCLLYATPRPRRT